MQTNSLISYINKHVTLTPDEAELLLKSATHRRYLKGQYVVQQGDVCRYENFVVKGCLKAFYVDQAGNEHIVMFAIENWWVSDLGSFLTQTPSDYHVQCLEDTELIQFTFVQIEAFYLEIPKLERLFRIIVQKAYVASQKRLVNNFSLPAKQRYLQFREQYPEIEQRVPQYMVASYLGITKEFLSKIKKQLVVR